MPRRGRGACLERGPVSKHAPPHLCEQTDTYENITFPQFRLRAVKMPTLMPGSSTPITVHKFCCRALLGQVEELSIYCGHGLLWSQEKREFLPDSTGCPEIIKMGNYMS